MTQAPLNRYQLAKAVRPLIADAQRIFTEAKVRPFLTFLAATAVEDANGTPVSLRIDVKSPGDARNAQSITLMITNTLVHDAEERVRTLERECGKAVKAMKYRGSLAVNNRANGIIPMDEIPQGTMDNVPAEIANQGGGE